MPLNVPQLLGVSPSGFDSQCKYVTAPFRPTRSPLALALVRLSIAGYTFFVLLFTVIWDSTKGLGDSYFSYFTHLSYIGVCCYFFATGVQTFVYAHRRRKGGEGYLLQRWPKWLQVLHVLLVSTVVTYPFIVTVVYWALLSGSDSFSTRFNAWDNISVHAINSAYALHEVLLTNTPPPPWLTLPFGLLCLGGYVGVAYITKATQGFYVYSFLDPQKQHALLAAYIVGIAIGECVVFALVRTVMVLRERYCIRRGLVGNGSGIAATAEDIDEWEEIERPKTPC
ncbi:hypothetical protein BDQ17DRAFT_1360100 [Cyathus striatus]|nr:hypothetical protein BDQ17DRAFT_1360100 [Cyathus striatus]